MKTMPKTAIALAALILSATAGTVTAQTAFAPVSVVNDDIITYYDVEQRARLMRLNGAEPGPALDAAALEDLVDDRLRLQAAEFAQVSVSEEELAAAINEFAGRYNLNADQLGARIRSLGADQSALNEMIRAQIVWRDLVTARFGSRATPSEIELDQEIAQAAAGQTRSFRLFEIAIPANEGQEAQAEQLMQRIQNELRAGADFTTLARRYSKTPSAKDGGNVGWILETSMPPDLAEIVAATPPGSITRPYQVPGGLSIYRVMETRDETPQWARDAQISYRRISVQGEGDDAASRARALGQDIDSCEATPDLAGQETMESIDRKLIRALPDAVRGLVQTLQAGQASRPVTTQGRTDVFVVCDRSGGVDAETRNRLREQIRVRRLSRLAEGYLQELRREAVIERR